MLRRFPAIETIFDGAAMGDRLQAAMVDGQRYVVERCAVGQALFLGGDECSLRYHLEMKERVTGGARRALLSARMFADAGRSQLHLRERLAPLASRVQQREETSCLLSPVAALDGLNMTVHAFPIDPDLPQLVEATEPHFMADLLRRTLLVAAGGRAFIQECQVEVAHYPRRYRCVLRYLVRSGGAGVEGSIVVYGKTYAEGQAIPNQEAIRALREAVLANPRGVRITIPRYAGFVSQMQLLLLEGIPGSPDIGRMIRDRAQGGDGAAPSGLTLSESIVACGATAATLHGSGAALGPIRTLEDDFAQLYAELPMVKRISPDLAARLEGGMAGLLEVASGTRAGPPCLTHGDFTYTQALFQGRDVGIVDLDNVCRAEPALDLGQFVAYLRVAVRKACVAASRPHEALSNELCDLFVSSYLDSAHIQDTDGLADRVRVYERLSLLRMVVRSWQQLKPARAANALAVLEERSA